MANKLLLVEDVEALGRSGDIVSVKPGYSRNFLLPKKLAVIATKQTLRLQERLQEERKQKAIVDRREADALAARLEGLALTKIVKVDQEGHMYGSVTAHDVVVLLLEKANIEVEKRHVVLAHPIKTTGDHKLTIKLPEGVTASFVLEVYSQEQKDQKDAALKAEPKAEPKAE